MDFLTTLQLDRLQNDTSITNPFTEFQNGMADKQLNLNNAIKS